MFKINSKLIVIDGLDGSGKSTQIELISKKLTELSLRTTYVKYPNYDSPTGQAVKMYLDGCFSEKSESVNLYAASCLFSADRYVGFKTKWENSYNNGDIIIADRYVSSNLIYQMSKLPENQWDDYFNWLYDFEYRKICLPKPCQVIFLDMDISVSQKLINTRYSGDDSKKDIHERDIKFLEKCRKAALYSAERDNWSIIKCNDGNTPLDIQLINEKILKIIKDTILHVKF